MPSIGYRARKRVERSLLPALLRKKRRWDLKRLGSDYGGYYVPMSLITSSSICYSAGVGEDISFDLALIDAKGCQVFAFDPTPRSMEHVRARAAAQPRFRFYPLGLWHQDETLRFYAPSDLTHVSHSVVNLQGTSEFFEAPCKRLSAIMGDLGHRNLDLLKLNIEGAQYAVIETILEDNLSIGVLCISIDQPTPPSRVFGTVRDLQRFGYSLVHVDRWNYTFVWRGDPR